MRRAIAEKIEAKRSYSNKLEETAVLLLRQWWTHQQPDTLCDFGLTTHEVAYGRHAAAMTMKFCWRNYRTNASDEIVSAPLKDFAYISVAAALLAELAALRKLERMPAAREDTYVQREKLGSRSMHRVGLTDTTEGAARAAAAS